MQTTMTVTTIAAPFFSSITITITATPPAGEFSKENLTADGVRRFKLRIIDVIRNFFDSREAAPFGDQF